MSKKHINGRESKHRIPNQYIINFKPGITTEEQEKIIKQFGGKVSRRFGKGLDQFVPVHIDDTTVEKLLAHEAVEDIDQDVIAEAPAENEGVNWGCLTASVGNFWDAGYTGKGVRVAIIDTGVSPHDDLPNILGGYNVEAGTADYTDISPSSNGHGTMSAGVIGAKKNGQGIMGVAYEADLYSICCYYPGTGSDTSAYTSVSLTTAALQYAYDMNPRPHIILCNVQLSGGSTALRNAVNNLVNAGIPILAAAGNFASTETDVSYPGYYDNVLSIGASQTNTTRPYIRRASYSQYGPHLDITSFTRQTATSKSGGYSNYTGTSCATPFATGVMALLKQAYPLLTATQLYDKLLTSAIHVDYGTDNEYGVGLINLPITILPTPPTYPLISSTTVETFQTPNFKFDLKGDWVIGMDGTRNILSSGAVLYPGNAVQTLKFRTPSNMSGRLEFDVRVVSASSLYGLNVYVNGELTTLYRSTSSNYGKVSIPIQAGKSYRVDLECDSGSSTTTAEVRISNLTLNLEVVHSITETFESSILTIPFTGDWVRTTTLPQVGSYCYRSATISHNQSSKTSFKITAPSGGTLEFYYRTDSEQNYDKLMVKAGSTIIVNGVSGTNGAWTKITHTLPTGTTEIEFTYKKDGSTSAGTDAAYIDQVAVTGANVSVSAGSSGSAPGTATISVASKTTSSVTLNLSASGATSFNVYRSTSATGTYTQIATSVTSPYINSGLSSGTTYYYKTEGKNSYGTGSMSSYVAATTDSAGSPPGTASISVASKTTSSVTLDLSASGATSFNVYRSTSATGTFTQIATSVTSPYTNTGLSSGTTYYYKTEGKNSNGTGSMSSYVSATTQTAGSPPGTPTLTVGGATTNSLTLTYSATGATSYDIYRGSTKIVSDRTSTTYTDSGLSANTTYSYYVVAKNSYGTATSATKSGTTLADSGITEVIVIDSILGLSNTGYHHEVRPSRPLKAGSTYSVYVGGDLLTSAKAAELSIYNGTVTTGTKTYTGTSNTELKLVASNVALPSSFVGLNYFRVGHDAPTGSYTNYNVAPGDASAHVSDTRRGKHRMVVVLNLKV